jgi:hypothetical protein
MSRLRQKSGLDSIAASGLIEAAPGGVAFASEPVIGSQLQKDQKIRRSVPFTGLRRFLPNKE